MSQRSLFERFGERLAPNEIKALSLWQPWASAIALGLKKVETRSWSTPYRGPLVIHAAKKWTGELKGLHKEMRAKYTQLPEDLPFGKAVCVVELKDCRVMDREWISEQSETELLFGDWRVGRYGWILENPRLFLKGRDMSMRGRQSLWSVSADDFLRKLRCDCCDLADEWNGYPEYERDFRCPKSCPCHD